MSVPFALQNAHRPAPARSFKTANKENTQPMTPFSSAKRRPPSSHEMAAFLPPHRPVLLPLKPSFIPLPPTRRQRRRRKPSSQTRPLPRDRPSTRSACSSSSGSSATLISPCPPQASHLTPTTRRRLAVEGLRKAASDAALRKIGLQLGPGWGNVSEKTAQEIPRHDQISQLSLFGPPQQQLQPVSHFSYLPRQYTPKPLLLPSKWARTGSVRSLSASCQRSLLLRQCTVSYHSSLSPVPSPNRQTEDEEPPAPDPHSPGEGDESLELKDSSVQMPLSQSTTASITTQDINDNQCMSSDSNRSNNQSISVTCTNGARYSPVDQEDDQRLGELPRSDRTAISAHGVAMAAFRWALAAPQATPGVPRRPAADHPRRQSLGGWLTSGWLEGSGGRSPKQLGIPFIEMDHKKRTLPPQYPKEDSPVIDHSILPDPVAHPVFLLPTAAARSHTWVNLRNLAAPRNKTWDSFMASCAPCFK